MVNNLIPPVKGTRDFYPEDQAFQNWFYQQIIEEKIPTIEELIQVYTKIWQKDYKKGIQIIKQNLTLEDYFIIKI